MSETVRELVGYEGDPLQFRSDFHLVEYFVVGLVIAVFGLSMRWKIWIPGVLGCGFGALDELIKIALPTREFGMADFVKDFVGVWVGVAVLYLVSYLGRGGHRGLAVEMDRNPD